MKMRRNKKLVRKNNRWKYVTIPLLLFVLVLGSSSIIGVEPNESAQPQLEIEQITGGFGVNTVITNVGNTSAHEVRWNTTVDGEFVIRGNSIIPPIPIVTDLKPGESISVSSWKYDYIFGFGNASVTVATSCKEGMTDQETKEAVLYGFLIGIY